MVYSDPEVNFKIESLSASTKYPDNKDGVLIIASPNEKGMKIIGHLIDLVSLIYEWYPGLANAAILILNKKCHAMNA